MNLTFKSAMFRGCLILAASAFTWAANSDLRLIQAVKSNDLASVTRLLKEKVNVNGPQGDGATALSWAAYKDKLPIADLLIRSGANPNLANAEGTTPLHLACTNRSAPMVERLLAAGANANAKLLNGETVLMTCSEAGEAKSVKALLAHGAKVNEKESGHDQTALMWAAAEAHPDVVKLLLVAGADVKARSLVYSSTVVGEQTQRAGREKLNYDIKRGGMTPLLFAARSGDVESAKLLIEFGASPSESSPDGMSALVLAAHSGHGDVGQVLLDKGADPNFAEIGYTALHAAALRDDLALTKALLAHHADPNLRITHGTPIRRSNTDYNLPFTLIGATPFLLASQFVEADIMRALAAGGADTKLTMPNGATALMLAAGNGSARNRRLTRVVEPESDVLAAIETAVSLGANVNAVDQAGDTALHTAVTKGYKSVISFLAAHGADLNVKNKRGQTPLTLAMTSGRGRRGAAAAAADADPDAIPTREAPHQGLPELLRKLGATQ